MTIARPALSLFVASTSFHDAHNLNGKVMGLMQARMQMDSASDNVRRPGSLFKQQQGVRITDAFTRYSNSMLVVKFDINDPMPCLDST